MHVCGKNGAVWLVRGGQELKNGRFRLRVALPDLSEGAPRASKRPSRRRGEKNMSKLGLMSVKEDKGEPSTSPQVFGE